MMSPTFVLLSFEGPDLYSHAGGLGTRVTELSKALASAGLETHLFFIGDPDLPGYESLALGKLHLHRWCQWISRYHRGGVYEGEEGKLRDWNTSLPAWLEANLLAPKIAKGEPVVIIGEEWQTAYLMTLLRGIVNRRGWQRQVSLLWNANNTFSFERIDWKELQESATITTVSRYMKHLMWSLGVDAQVVPNGIPDCWLEPTPRQSIQASARLFKDRLTLIKVARWDPDKRWDMAVDAVAELKAMGVGPLFLVRGGVEAHGYEVMARAVKQGLNVASVEWKGTGLDLLLDALRPALNADMIVLRSFLSETQRRTLFHTAHAVLANSGREPFGLVGLETMAVGGIAMVGCTGEDYATPGHDAIALQTSNPREIVQHVMYLRNYKEFALRLRQAARRSASRYTWPAVIRRGLLPLLGQLGLPVAPPETPIERDHDNVESEMLLPLAYPVDQPPPSVVRATRPEERPTSAETLNGHGTPVPVASRLVS